MLLSPEYAKNSEHEGRDMGKAPAKLVRGFEQIFGKPCTVPSKNKDFGLLSLNKKELAENVRI